MAFKYSVLPAVFRYALLNFRIMRPSTVSSLYISGSTNFILSSLIRFMTLMMLEFANTSPTLVPPIPMRRQLYQYHRQAVKAHTFDQ